MKIAQIVNGKVHHIFYSELIPDIPPDAEGNSILLIDITERNGVVEGWNYFHNDFFESTEVDMCDIVN